MKDQAAADQFLTVPDDIEDYTPWLATGNEYVALPTVAPMSAGLHSANLLHRGARGLIEFCGDRALAGTPLVKPIVCAQGSAIELAGEWQRLDYWLPAFSARQAGTLVRGLICAPIGIKGWLYQLEITNESDRPVEYRAELAGSFAEARHTIFSSSPVCGHKRAGYSRWTKGVYIEALAGLPIAAAAFCCSHEFSYEIDGAQPQEVMRGMADEPITFRLWSDFTLAAGESRTIAFYCGVNRERDGAGTALVHMRRMGQARLLAETRAWLAAARARLPVSQLAEKFYGNLFFNYFYSVGRSIDSDDLLLMTSRSPLYYVSAAFWERDSLLWSLPALLLVDTKLARAAIVSAFRLHADAAGEHAHYVDGGVLYPGFELDQLCAYYIAVSRYIDMTGDRSILEEREIAARLPALDELLMSRKHETEWLFSTFLIPSDDPARYTYVTYNNALVWRVCMLRAQWSSNQFERAEWMRRAVLLRAAIMKHLVVEADGRRQFAFSADLAGNHELYDDPPGSLQLLVHYEFIRPDDEIYLNTVDWIYSARNQYYFGEAPLRGAGCQHHPANPAVLSLCADLLGVRAAAAAQILTRAPLDNTIACESYSCQTGWVKTGAHFATCAGWLAYAIYTRFGTGAREYEN